MSLAGKRRGREEETVTHAIVLDIEQAMSLHSNIDTQAPRPTGSGTSLYIYPYLILLSIMYWAS